jgi:hypothetical protein
MMNSRVATFLLAAAVSVSISLADKVQAAEQTPKDAFIQFNQSLIQAPDLFSIAGLPAQKKKEYSTKTKNEQFAEFKDEKSYALKNLERVKEESIEGHVATVSGHGLARDDKGKDYFAKVSVTLVKQGDNWEVFSKSITNSFSPMNNCEIEKNDSVDERIRKRLQKHWKLVNGDNWVGVIANVAANGTVSGIKTASSPKNAEAETAVRTAFSKAGPLVAPAELKSVKLPGTMHLTFSSVYTDKNSSFSMSGPYFRKLGEEIPQWLVHTGGSSIKFTEKPEPPHKFGNPKTETFDAMADDIKYAVEKKDWPLALTYADVVAPYLAKRPSSDNLDYSNELQMKAAQKEMQANRALVEIKEHLIKSKDFATAERLAKIHLSGAERREPGGGENIIALTDLAEIYIYADRDAEAEEIIAKIAKMIVAMKAEMAKEPPMPSTMTINLNLNGKENSAAMKQKMAAMMAGMKRAFEPLSMVVATGRLYLAYKKVCKDDKAQAFEDNFIAMVKAPLNAEAGGAGAVPGGNPEQSAQPAETPAATTRISAPK